MLKLRINPYSSTLTGSITSSSSSKSSSSSEKCDKYSCVHDETKESILSFRMLANFNRYPETTNYHCWWCCHSFTSRPLGMPKKIEKQNILCIGVFCSFACILAFVKEGGGGNTLVGKCNPSSVYYMYKLITGDGTKNPITNPIHTAPPRYTLEMFGGILSIEQFRENICVYDTFLAPMIPLTMIYHTKEVDEYITNQTNRQKIIFNSNITNDRSSSSKIPSSSVSSSSKASNNKQTKIVNRCAGCLAANVISWKKQTVDIKNGTTIRDNNKTNNISTPPSTDNFVKKSSTFENVKGDNNSRNNSTTSQMMMDIDEENHSNSNSQQQSSSSSSLSLSSLSSASITTTPTAFTSSSPSSSLTATNSSSYYTDLESSSSNNNRQRFTMNKPNAAQMKYITSLFNFMDEDDDD